MATHSELYRSTVAASAASSRPWCWRSLNGRRDGPSPIDAQVEVLVTAYDLEQRDAFFYRRQRAREDARCDVPMRAAARATSAAPTYFEPALVQWPQERDVLVDGGVFANSHVRQYGRATVSFP